MNDLTPTQQPQQFGAYSGQAPLIIELAKSLKLVAPISMSEDAQKVWLQAAVDALEGISAAEVASVSAELRRSVTRAAQIVPEISRLVDEKRKRRTAAPSGPASPEWAITQEAQQRRAMAKSQDEVEEAWLWERNARLDAGLPVPPLQKPFTPAELEGMPREMAALGLKYGFLRRENGRLVETP